MAISEEVVVVILVAEEVGISECVPWQDDLSCQGSTLVMLKKVSVSNLLSCPNSCDLCSVFAVI